MKLSILIAAFAVMGLAAPAAAGDYEPFNCYTSNDNCTGPGKSGIKQLKQCQKIIADDPQAHDGGSWMDNHGQCHPIQSDGSVG